jgi:pimeloyl-ACP methyl ester carboxylesterase
MQQFTSFDDAEIAYFAFGAPAPALCPVILHHGAASDHAESWIATNVIERLISRGLHGYALDARGHGQSTKHHDPARYGEPVMAKDLLALVDHLGLQQVDLVGYSMGGVVAIMAAVDEPRVRSVVVGGIGRGVVRHGGLDIDMGDPRLAAEALEADDPSTITDPLLRAFREMTDAAGHDRLAYAAVARATFKGTIALDCITAPTLVLVGDNDTLAQQPELLADAIPRARLQLVGGDHFSTLLAPEWADALASFLAPNPDG